MYCVRPAIGRWSARTIGVLISGRGSNLQALIDAIAERPLAARIAVVISNRPDAGGLERARAPLGSRRWCSITEAFPRATIRRALARELQARGVVAGVSRGLHAARRSARCSTRFQNAILNIHPSLLPAFPGVDAQRQALDHGVKVDGATVHLVTAELDGGPIVVQASVPVRDDDTVETLSARILIEEHRIYPEAVRLMLDGGWTVEGRRFRRAQP